MASPGQKVEMNWFRISPILLIVFTGILIPGGKLLARNYGPHTGYMSMVQRAREESVKEVIVFTPPPPDKPPLKDRIFDEKLTDEFVDRYHQKFGYTEQQRAYLAPNSHTYYNDMNSYQGTQEQTDKEKRRFGDYILRRIGEHHFDRAFKDDPKFNSVYVAKQNVTTASATVSKEIKFGGKYNIGSNTANFSVKNPWLDVRATMEMGRTSQETIVSIGRQLTPTYYSEAHLRKKDGILTLVQRKAFTPLFSTSFSLTTFTNTTGGSVRATVYLAGLNWTY